MKNICIIQKLYNIKSKGFTLAEVLVTIAIIGVVAALTIPSLVQITQDNQFKIAYKKAIRDANLALKNAGADDLLLPMTAQNDTSAMNNNFNIFMSKFIVAKPCLSGDNSACWDRSGEFITSPGNTPPIGSDAFIDNSGVAWVMYNKAGGEALIMVDTNNFKGPNQYGKDRWFLKFIDSTGSRISGIPVSVMPYLSDQTTSTWICHYPPCYYWSWLTQ